jgi:lipopolysaccharide transport system permease protein
MHLSNAEVEPVRAAPDASGVAPLSGISPEVPLPASTSLISDEPVIVLEPSKSWSPLNLRDLWSYRELLYFLTWRDVKIRYKQSVLGITWAILQPLCTMLLFTLLFGRLAKLPTDNIPAPLFYYAGVLLWTFFANAINNSGNSLTGNANLITKVFFPRMIVPASSVASGLVDLAIAFVLLVPLMLWYQVEITFNLLAVPLFILLSTLLALGVGMWMAALNVKYRDIRHALPFIVQLWMFASGVMIPPSAFGSWRWLFSLNPMVGIIDGFRSALFGRPFHWGDITLSAMLTLLILVCAAFSFRRLEKTFADIV